MPTILDRIVDAKRHEIHQAKQRISSAELERSLWSAPPVRNFMDALVGGPSVRLIAELKKASPSRGILREDFDPVMISREYAHHGAHCISVLTDGPFFQGSLSNLQTVRASVHVPLLRKDFIVDTYQLLEARCAGADAVLLIAECLDDCQLRSLHQRTMELGMTPLVEFYEAANAQRVVDAGATLIGINNRDLHTFQVDLLHCLRMRRQLPDDCVVVAESGINGPDDVRRLREAGIQAMLVGEHLITQRDIGQAVRALLQ